MIQTQTRLVNQLTACLKEYYPAALHLFAKVQQRSTLVFLQTYPTPQAAQAASVEEITATLRTGKHTNPTQGGSQDRRGAAPSPVGRQPRSSCAPSRA